MENISIVTGGSSGLGKEIVYKLLEKGKKVCIISRDENKILEAIKNKENVIYYAGDVSDEEFIKNTIRDITKSYYIDYLYNVAGLGISSKPEELYLKDIQKVFKSNTIGLMVVTCETLRHMTNGGTIVNVMSTAALKGNAIESAYCAAKWAAKGFTEALQTNYKNTNIKVIGVYPGGMKTPFWDNNRKVDLTTFMDPKEVANTIVFNVLENKTSYISNIVIERR